MNDERFTPPAQNRNVYAPQHNAPVYNGGAGGPEVASAENYALGILGAVIFSLGGALVYFGLYQLNFIAGISGFIMFVLAQLGYNIFAKTNRKTTLAGMITSIVVMLVMIFVSEYFCLAFEIFNVFKDQGITFADAVAATPAFLAEPEVGNAVAGDLAFAYGFGIFAVISNIITFFKQRKAAKIQASAPQAPVQDQNEVNF